MYGTYLTEIKLIDTDVVTLIEVKMIWLRYIG